MRISWDLLNEKIAACDRCALCTYIHNKVPGQGDGQAKIMLIGEGPGADEDMQGLAFVGAAGQLLTKMLAAIEISREDVFICNVVKCRPPQNRQPTPEEAAACLPYLRAQFALVQPKIVVLLGATAARAILGEQARITRDRGKWTERKGVWFMPTYHPAALLRDPDKKREAWQDLKEIKKKLSEVAHDGDG